MRILHILADMENRAAGPSVSVPRLAEAQASLGADVEIASVADPDTTCEVSTTVVHTRYRQSFQQTPLLSRFYMSRTMRATLMRDVEHWDVVHSHGLWLAPNVYPAIMAKRGTSWVVSPRGMLGGAALSFSPYKKRAFWHLFQKRALQHAHLVHATSVAEAEEATSHGITAQSIVVPNGVQLPQMTSRRDMPLNTILSLGRLHPKKGLDQLIMAWAAIADVYPTWNLKIVGPDENNYKAELLKRVKRERVPRVQIFGPVYGEDKQRAYDEAGVFVLPSLHENFALTVAEALASGVPVISTKGAPWEGLEVNRCGRWVDHGAPALAAGLGDLLELSQSERIEMGERGREWMAREYSWRRIGARLLRAYEAV